MAQILTGPIIKILLFLNGINIFISQKIKRILINIASATIVIYFNKPKTKHQNIEKQPFFRKF